MESLSERVKKARKAAGLSQAEMSRRLGISTAAMSMIETGQTKTLKASTLTALERVTGYSGEWLVSGRGPEKGGTSSQVDRIYKALVALPPEHRARVESEIEFLLSLNQEKQ